MITEEVVQDVFGLAVKVIPDPVAGTPMVVPIGRHTTRTDRRADTGHQHRRQALAASAAANGICRPTDRCRRPAEDRGRPRAPSVPRVRSPRVSV